MKRLRNLLAAALVCGSLIGGCGSDGDGTDIAAIQQALEECSQGSIASMLQVLFAIVTVPDVIAGEDPLPGFEVNATLSADPADPPNTWDFTAIFDTNANGIPDTSVVGSFTFSDDPTDGLAPLSTIDISFTVQNSVVAGASDSGTLTGSGDLFATLGATPDEVAITGTISLTDTAGDGCEATLTFPEEAPLNLDFGDELPAQLAANLELFEIFGTIAALIETMGHELDATVTLVDGDQTATVTGTIDGVDVDFDFEILPPEEVINAMFSCTFIGFEWAFFFVDTFQDIVAGAQGGTLPPGVTVTPTANPNVFNYLVDLVVLEPGSFSAGTVSGQATLTFPAVTQLSGLAPSEVAFTWTINAATFTGGGVATGQNATGRPFRLFFEGGVFTASEGAGTVTLTPPAVLSGSPIMDPCVVTFDIVEPIAADESDGFVLLTVTIGEDVMNITLDFDEEEGVVTINGVPFPFLAL